MTVSDNGVLTVANRHREGPLAEIHRSDFTANYLKTEAHGLCAKVVHKLGALYAFDIAGEVLYICRGDELAAGLCAFDHDRVKICTRGIDAGSVSCGACAYDEASCSVLAHIYVSYLFLS